MKGCEKMSFQDNLKFYREKAGYKTAKDFAKILSVSYDAYIGYENKGREPKYSVLVEIAQTLGVTTDELLDSNSTEINTIKYLKELKSIKMPVKIEGNKVIIDALIAFNSKEDFCRFMSTVKNFPMYKSAVYNVWCQAIILALHNDLTRIYRTNEYSDLADYLLNKSLKMATSGRYDRETRLLRNIPIFFYNEKNEK